MSKPAVWCWWNRFLAEGARRLLRDAKLFPGKKPIPQDCVRSGIVLAMPPPEHIRHWTVWALAKRLGMFVSTVHGIFEDHGLRPRKVKVFGVSLAPRFETWGLAPRLPARRLPEPEEQWIA